MISPISRVIAASRSIYAPESRPSDSSRIERARTENKSDLIHLKNIILLSGSTLWTGLELGLRLVFILLAHAATFRKTISQFLLAGFQMRIRRRFDETVNRRISFNFLYPREEYDELGGVNYRPGHADSS